MVRHQVKAVNGNCLPLDDTVLLQMTSSKKSTIQVDAQDIGVLKCLGEGLYDSAKQPDTEDFPPIDLSSDNILLKDVITTYMAG